jgi:hypothetical protein
MKSKAVFLLLISACVWPLQTPDNWSKYTSPEGRYSILFPGKPELKTQESTDTDGQKVLKYRAASSSRDVTCLVGYFDIRPGRTFSFDKARDEMVDGVETKLLAERNISLGNSPGRELKIVARAPSGRDVLVVARYYQVGDRVYLVQFIVMKSSENMIAKESGRYFDSFQVTGSH